MADDDATWTAMVEAIAPIEDRAFHAVSHDNVAYCVSQGWVDANLLDGAA